MIQGNTPRIELRTAVSKLDRVLDGLTGQSVICWVIVELSAKYCGNVVGCRKFSFFTVHFQKSWFTVNFKNDTFETTFDSKASSIRNLKVVHGCVWECCLS